MPKLIGKFWAALAMAVASVLGFPGSAEANKPFPYIYVLDGSTGSIGVVDTGAKSVVAKIPIANAPIRGVITPDARTIFAIDVLSNLYAIDTTRNIVTSKISAGPGSSAGPLGMVITPDGANLYFSIAGGAVVHFATATNVIVKSIPLPTSPETGGGMAISPDGKKVFVAVPDSDSVVVIDTATDQVTGSIPVGSYPAELAITPDGKKLYVVNATTVSVVATESKSVIKTIPVAAIGSSGGSWRAIAISPDGSRVYVNEGPNKANVATGNLAIIATSTDSVIDRIYSGVGLLAASPDGAHIFVSDTDRLVVIDSATDRPVMAIPGLGYVYGIFSGSFRSQSTLRVSVTGNGTVTSKPAGIGCGANCSVSVGTGSILTLTATASSGSVFAGWSGACSGTSDCTIVLGDDATVSAMFSPAPTTSKTLSVSVTGTGKGTVATAPSGIRCGTACAASYASGSTVVLAASPEPGSAFSGWNGGGCSGTGTCTIALDADTAVTARFAPVAIPDTLSVLVNGSGRIVGNSAGIDCTATYYQPTICAAPVQSGTTVTLTALSNGAVFTGWSGGGCSGTATCSVTLGGDTAVTANFSILPSTTAVYVQVQGNGSGTISSNPTGLYCNLNACSAGVFTSGTTVTLTASPDTGSTFAGWGGGACAGTGPCTLTLTSYTQLTATFTSNSQNATMSVFTSGTGGGSIRSNPSVIDCGTICSNSYAIDSTLTLTATPDSGSVFLGWTGDCFSTTLCSVYLNQSKVVGAIFAPVSFSDTLSVSLAGTGSGGVSGNPLVISCGTICSAALTDNTQIGLTAVAATGSVFTGWSNPQCGSFTTCSLTLRADTSLTATFQPASSLTVVNSGTAQGSVSSTIPGISCPSTCTALFATGTRVTLTPMSAFFFGPTFLGWSGGGCNGTGNCTVTLNADTTVSANFAVLNHTVSVTRAGTGSGTVTSDTGISCGTICSITAPDTSFQLLTATADNGSTFVGWGGACSDTSTCFLPGGADRAVTATFTAGPITPPPATVNLTVNSAGLGQVTFSPQNITCTLCTAIPVPSGVLVTLTASPSAGYNFTGWSGGGCSGTGPCNLVPTADTTVIATFTQGPVNPTLSVLTITRSGTGSGTTGISPVNNSCTAVSCSFPKQGGTALTVLEAAAPGSIFKGWNGACSGTGACIVTANADQTVNAEFALTKTITVSKTGNGAGVVTTSPAGITCGATCSASFEIGKPVTLNAAASQGSVFAGWSGGGCSGTGICAVTPNADTTVTASFTLVPTTAMLSVAKTGSGTVASSPSGIACGPTCNASFPIGLIETLTATSDAGWTFAGWSGSGCSGNKQCTVSMTADRTVAATFVADSTTDIILVSATLPSSRSVQVGATATLFGTLINVGPGTATYCSVAMAGFASGGFSFQTTDRTTNAPTGIANTPVDIPEGAAQTFLLAFIPSTTFAPVEMPFNFSCSNAAPAKIYPGVNTLLISSSPNPVPDIVALAGTSQSDGTVHIDAADGVGAFVVAISNVGSGAQITAIADTGGANLPVTLSICRTNPTTGICVSTPAASVLANFASFGTGTFAIFAQASGAVPFMPAVNRVFVRFVDSGGVTRGSTSVAVRTP
ncbi:MAG: hypothetical protein JWM91_4292 [Rhodospirillales bacterium]|nr:hypothetical protein [Rhodospirillales bacterium]